MARICFLQKFQLKFSFQAHNGESKHHDANDKPTWDMKDKHVVNIINSTDEMHMKQLVKTQDFSQYMGYTDFASLRRMLLILPNSFTSATSRMEVLCMLTLLDLVRPLSLDGQYGEED
jgi:hypothetical protein